VAPIDNPSAVATLQARINAMESAHAIALHANNHQAWENGVAAPSAGCIQSCAST